MLLRNCSLPPRSGTPLFRGRVTTISWQLDRRGSSSWLRARYSEGVSPTSSAKRAENEPRLVQPTAKQTSVTLRSPCRSRAFALDPAGHEVGVGRLRVGLAEAPAEVRRRHQRRAGERSDVERPCVLPVHLVSGPAEPTQLVEIGVHDPILHLRYTERQGESRPRSVPCREAGGGFRPAPQSSSYLTF